MSKTTLKVNDRELSISNPEKDLYPSYGFTKARILEYYSRIAPFMLPYLKNRALTLKRYPHGVDQDFFFEKRCPSFRPVWLKTAEIPYGKKKQLTACMINDLEALIWVENLASIELHVPLACAQFPDNPDSVVFDLDPGEGADILDCTKVALILENLFKGLKLTCYVKTSGKKGLHVYIPLNSKETTFDHTKSFSRAIAETLQKNYSDLVTSKMAIDARRKKVFINWSQNDASKTMVCVYSLRAAEKPMVSFPLDWNELKTFSKQKDPGKIHVLHSEAIARVKKNGDIFQEMLVKKQRLPYI